MQVKIELVRRQIKSTATVPKVEIKPGKNPNGETIP